MYTQAAEAERLHQRGRNNHASSAVCGNGAQRTIKWISLFQDDRLPHCPGPINCDTPAPQSHRIGEAIPGDGWRAGKLLRVSGPL